MTTASQLTASLGARAAVVLLFVFQGAVAAPNLSEIQQQWDIINFQLTGDAQLESFEQLRADAETYTDAHPDEVEGWIWRGIIDSSYAGAKGGLGALGLAKSARKHFDKAISMNGEAMHGSAYTSLGTLYYSVPGWPIGFGNDAKAAELLQQGLSIDPDGMDSNYFYAEFLARQDQHDEAVRHYRKALDAPPRPGRAVADDGRRKQIQAALAAN
ncbi:MAG: hypothetical protein V2J12_07715 [Gammaproteobacteria bacterium]|jgi:tetratricopeptide (TPR) repeat protein|nr:hypothetical protein [Gammaproteobacteria bacterium]